jgi:hypothetical protein
VRSRYSYRWNIHFSYLLRRGSRDACVTGLGAGSLRADSWSVGVAPPPCSSPTRGACPSPVVAFVSLRIRDMTGCWDLMAAGRFIGAVSTACESLLGRYVLWLRPVVMAKLTLG